MTQHIIEPLLSEQAELIVEDVVFADSKLRDRMLNDVRSMSDDTKRIILSAMLKMHKEIADYCGDLDVSLKSIEEIAENTESWYVILMQEALKRSEPCDTITKRIGRLRTAWKWWSSTAIKSDLSGIVAISAH